MIAVLIQEVAWSGCNNSLNSWVIYKQLQICITQILSVRQRTPSCNLYIISCRVQTARPLQKGPTHFQQRNPRCTTATEPDCKPTAHGSPFTANTQKHPLQGLQQLMWKNWTGWGGRCIFPILKIFFLRKNISVKLKYKPKRSFLCLHIYIVREKLPHLVLFVSFQG